MSFNQLEKNLTTSVVAEKFKAPLPIGIESAIVDTNRAIDKLNGLNFVTSDLLPNQNHQRKS